MKKHGLRSRTGLQILIVLMLSISHLQAEEPTQKRPNILFALADDWGWPHAGAYGDPVVKTPTFDRLAREGLLFEHAYISAPSCTPSRNAILTGQQFYRLGTGASLWSSLDVKIPNFMFLLRKSGYEIAHWRKAWGPGDYKIGGYTEHPCGPQKTFEKFMKNRDPSKPFCFWFGTSDPHRPYKPGSGRESGMDLNAIDVPPFFPDNEVVRSDIADYYWEVQRWDSDVAKAIKLLEQAGELENTIIVMTGDHGMPFPHCKANLYEMGAHVPLAIRWGKIAKPSRKIDRFVSLTDLAPTFLTLANAPVPDVMTGKNLIPLLTAENPKLPKNDFIVFGRERHTPAQKMPSMDGYPVRALRTDRWILILNLEPNRWPAGVPTGSTHPMNQFADCDDGPTKNFIIDHQADPAVAPFYQLCFAQRPAVELYDCKTDPAQIKNLAANPEYAEVVKQLTQQLTAYLSKTDDPRFTSAPVQFDTYPYEANYLKKHLKKFNQQSH